MTGIPLKEAVSHVHADKMEIIRNWEDLINERSEEDYRHVIQRAILIDWMNALLEDLVDGLPDAWDSVSQREAARLASMGVNEDFFRVILGCLSTVLWDYAIKRWNTVPATALEFLRQASILIIRGRTEMAAVFLDKRLDMIKKQQQALTELSTPVIPLLDDILVVPLIGTIDTARANQIMENILDGITQRDAEIVIIDITGVHIVDSTVAHHLIKAYQAASLLGAKCIMVGMRPDVAQTIVQLDIAFDNIDTKNNLAQGIEYALQLQGRKIIEVNGSEVI